MTSIKEAVNDLQKQYTNELHRVLNEPLPPVLIGLVQHYVPTMMPHMVLSKKCVVPDGSNSPVQPLRNNRFKRKWRGRVLEVPHHFSDVSFRVRHKSDSVYIRYGMECGSRYSFNIYTSGGMSVVVSSVNTKTHFINWCSDKPELLPLTGVVYEYNRTLWWDDPLQCMVLCSSPYGSVSEFQWINGNGETIQKLLCDIHCKTVVHVGCGGVFTRDNFNIVWFTTCRKDVSCATSGCGGAVSGVSCTPCYDLTNQRSDVRSVFDRLIRMEWRVGDPSKTSIRRYERIPAIVKFYSVEDGGVGGEIYIHSLLHFLRDWRRLRSSLSMTRLMSYETLSVNCHTVKPEDQESKDLLLAFPHTEINWVNKDHNIDRCAPCMRIFGLQKNYSQLYPPLGFPLDIPHDLVPTPPVSLVEAEATDVWDERDLLFTRRSFAGCSLNCHSDGLLSISHSPTKSIVLTILALASESASS